MKKNDGIIRTGSRCWVTLFCLGICLAAAGSWGQVQDPRRQEKKPAFEESFQPEEEQPTGVSLEEMLGQKTASNSQALEGPIDPATYKLGPGDLIGVTVMGQVDRELTARVTADGVLRLPTIGLFDVGNRFFSEVKDTILAQARRSYRTPQMAVYLLELRSFKASIGGRVRQPGTYAMTPIDRVASLVSRAGGFYNPEAARKAPRSASAYTEERDGKTHHSDLLPPVPVYSTRHVELIHRDGTKQIVDLLLFLRAGRPEGNPYLQDGDFLLVPPLNPQAGLLGVFGAVNNQGSFEYLPGDNLERALLLAGDLTPEARRDSVEITRFNPDHTGYTTFYVSLDDSIALNTTLQADDRIFVRPRILYHPRYQVELQGEVVKPGFYPVGAEGTRLADILKLAGGCTPRASLREATLTRRLGQELVDPEFERLRLMTAAEMTPLEYQYYKAKSQESKGRVVLDLDRLYAKGDSTQNILLRDQDILEVPVISRTIKVSGQVTQPGIVDYTPGKDYTWYVEKTGGFSWNARRGKARIIKAISGKWVKPGKTNIEEGDTIFIPEKSDLDYWQLSKDIMLVLAQAATIYLVIQNANK